MRDLRFQLMIEAGPTGGYTVHALSPRGEGTAPFVPPFTPGAVEAAASRGSCSFRSFGEEALETPAALGERLFTALFQGEVLRLYERSLDLLEGAPEARLRLEILFDPRNAHLAVLQRLPWELLRQPDAPEALALSRRRPVVRYLAVPRPIYAAVQPTVLRILAVGANPQHPDLLRLDIDRELLNLRKAAAMARAGTIEVVEPEAPTLAALRRALLEQECHALHFMGHGGDVEESKGKVLFFQSEDGGVDPVSGPALMNKLADFPTLRLAVLNACESAVAGSFDPFAGVATSLVLGGLPAVVAMRLPITDQASIAFSRAFYQRLAMGDPVDAAVAEGRQAVHSGDPNGLEWSSPVLFMRTPNGELFPKKNIPPDSSPQRAGARQLVAALLVILGLAAGASFAVRAGRVQHLVAEGVAFAQHGQWREARKMFLAALKLAPRSAEVQSDLAGAEEHVGYFWAAEKYYRGAVRLEPRSGQYLYDLGYFLNGRRRYRDAYEALQKAVRWEPARVDIYGELASAAIGLGRLDDARETLATALKLDPKRPILHRIQGELKLSADRPAAALVDLEEAHRSYPLDARGRAETVPLLIQAYDRLGDRLATCREVDEFRRLDPLVTTPWIQQVTEVAIRHGCS